MQSMPSTRPSVRPECIRITVLGEDDRWTRDLARQLGDKMGAKVDCVTRLYINGAQPSFHVLIVKQSADPDLVVLRTLRKKWSEQEVPVIVVGDDDAGEVDAIRAGASQFVDRSLHPDTVLLEKPVYGLAYDNH